jgi:hypothetical protein
LPPFCCCLAVSLAKVTTRSGRSRRGLRLDEFLGQHAPPKFWRGLQAGTANPTPRQASGERTDHVAGSKAQVLKADWLLLSPPAWQCKAAVDPAQGTELQQPLRTFYRQTDTRGHLSRPSLVPGKSGFRTSREQITDAWQYLSDPLPARFEIWVPDKGLRAVVAEA